MGGVANEEVLHEGVTGAAEVGGAPFLVDPAPVMSCGATCRAILDTTS